MPDDPRAQLFGGYHSSEPGEPNRFLTQVGPRTPGGEYLRRFWQPVALTSEIKDLPLRVRILGEDLVAFRDGSGRYALLHLNCCHRGTSLEFGRIEKNGIRCCYHGRLFDIDGRILEVLGDPFEDRIKSRLAQGAYPTHVFAGVLFAYMGPPDKISPFPVFDHFGVPGVRLALPLRLPFACNWVQLKENALDPAHTAVLHAWEDRFADQFGVFPEFEFSEGPSGAFYLAVRRVENNIWIRSTSIIMPNLHVISSVLQSGQTPVPVSNPYLSFFTAPVDDTNSVSFAIPHIGDDESLEERMAFGWVGTGQTDERPYHERQKVPGDYDAQVGQGAIEQHSKENLGYHDRGIVLFRRLLKRGIEAVQRGEDPPGLYREGSGPIPSFATDRVVPCAEFDGDLNERAVLRRIGVDTARSYLDDPPMKRLGSAVYFSSAPHR